MKIGIDISQLAYPGTGVATYTENLVKALLKIDQKNEYLFFYSSLRKQFQISNPEFLNKSKIPNSQIKTFRFPPIFLETLWNHLHVLPIERLIGKVDIFHTSDWLEPPSKYPKVTTIHDLAVLKYPETFSPKGGHDIVANLKRKFEWVKKESKFVIAVSENTKKDIVELLGIPEKKIRVVYEAVDEIYNKECTASSIQLVNNKYNLHKRYILTVGTREPRKNLERVIEAFRLLSGEDLQLVIAGKYGWGNEKNIGESTDLKVLGFVPKEDLQVLYSGAEVFVYPSLYEGFGLPILEAMASGCPVVTSNVSSLPEIAGNAAVLVNPLEAKEIATGVKKALKEKGDLIRRGYRRIREFSWEKAARETIEVYKEANC